MKLGWLILHVGLFVAFPIRAESQCLPPIEDKAEQEANAAARKATNVKGETLTPCSLQPRTGWFRDGSCRTDANDRGRHLVCAVMTTSLWETSARVDAIDPLLALSGAFLSGPNPFQLRKNDGLVPTDSMSWGTLLACIPADHFDQMGQVADLTPSLVSGFDHLDFYRNLLAHIRRLEATWQMPPQND